MRRQSASPVIHTPCRPLPLSSFPLSSPPAAPASEAWPRDSHRFIMSSPTRAPSPQFDLTSHRDARPTGSLGTSKFRFSARQKRLKPSILQQNSNCDSEAREIRRNSFLKKVREASEQKRWRDRKIRSGELDEEILRALWLVERKQWREQRRQEALSLDYLGELEDIPEELPGAENGSQELEEFAIQEENSVLDMENMLDRTIMNQTYDSSTMALYEIEDEEYDSIFKQFIEEEDAGINPVEPEIRDGEDQEMMDTS